MIQQAYPAQQQTWTHAREDFKHKHKQKYVQKQSRDQEALRPKVGNSSAPK